MIKCKGCLKLRIGVGLDETGKNLKINFVLMLGAESSINPTPVEVVLNDLLRLTAYSTLQAAQRSNKFSRLLALTNDPGFEPPPGVLLFPDEAGEGDFHFGQKLRTVVAKLPPDEGLVYMGGGAGLLSGQAEWAGLELALRSAQKVVTANNYFSADLVGWRPGAALLDLPEVELPASDNNLAWALCRRAGLSWQAMLPNNQRSLGMQFDIDTPSDAAALKLWLSYNQAKWPHLAEVNHFLAQSREFDLIPVQPILAALSDFGSEVLVSGRISAGLHRTLELRSHGQTRILSEERGMRADGRDSRGEVQSLAGFLLEELGPKRFFERLAKSADAAILDSRVLFAHLKRQPDRADRFNSDAFQTEQVKDPLVRAFTEAALEARERWNFPVLLGGHSMVSGSLLLLLELAPPKDY